MAFLLVSMEQPDCNYFALLVLILSHASSLFAVGKVERNPSKCFFNKNQSPAWIRPRSGRARANKNSKSCWPKKQKAAERDVPPPWNC